MTTWEINHTKAGTDVKPGPMMTAEYGVGKKFLKGGLTLGGSGYYYRKLISDSGADIQPITRGLIDQAFGSRTGSHAYLASGQTVQARIPNRALSAAIWGYITARAAKYSCSI